MSDDHSPGRTVIWHSASVSLNSKTQFATLTIRSGITQRWILLRSWRRCWNVTESNLIARRGIEIPRCFSRPLAGTSSFSSVFPPLKRRATTRRPAHAGLDCGCKNGLYPPHANVSTLGGLRFERVIGHIIWLVYKHACYQTYVQNLSIDKGYSCMRY